MTAAPPVSVILPVRDAAPFLEEALASLRTQTYGDFEVVLQDDGSADASLAIAREAARLDRRLRVESGAARGVAAAANAAARRARGALHVRMDADDVARPERVACLVALAREHPDAGLLASRARYFPREAVGPGMARYEAWLDGLLTHEAIHRERFVEYPLPHPTTAVRAEVFEALGGYREGDFPEDYDFFLRAASAGVRFAKHPAVLLDWREGPHRSTKRDARYGLERFHALKVRHLAPWLRTLGRPLAIVGAGRDGKRWARALAREGLAPRWFVDLHPRRRGTRIHGADVLAYEDLGRARDAFLLAAVGRAGGREAVREALAARGLQEERDFLCVQ